MAKALAPSHNDRMGAFQIALGFGSTAGGRLGTLSHVLCPFLLTLGAVVFLIGLALATIQRGGSSENAVPSARWTTSRTPSLPASTDRKWKKRSLTLLGNKGEPPPPVST